MLSPWPYVVLDASAPDQARLIDQAREVLRAARAGDAYVLVPPGVELCWTMVEADESRLVPNPWRRAIALGGAPCG